MNGIKVMYNSFLWALMIAITCFKSEWLEMRVNVGYILFGAFIILSIISSIYCNKKKYKLNTKFTLINLIICFIYSIILYGFKRLQIVPASIIREGINMTRVPFSKINSILVVILIVGISTIFLSDRKEYNKSNENILAR